jgi:hypothetical protein
VTLATPEVLPAQLATSMIPIVVVAMADLSETGPPSTVLGRMDGDRREVPCAQVYPEAGYLRDSENAYCTEAGKKLAAAFKKLPRKKHRGATRSAGLVARTSIVEAIRFQHRKAGVVVPLPLECEAGWRRYSTCGRP